ncbi:MAG: hypothetical protein MUC98_08505, partial [Desulfobacterota bacterium]|nr:hypothetical protein [Thermodesulfobacteriota bacterium]
DRSRFTVKAKKNGARFKVHGARSGKIRVHRKDQEEWFTMNGPQATYNKQLATSNLQQATCIKRRTLTADNGQR